MSQELKIYITDPLAIETKLQSLGATLSEETNFTDTYFNQPEGEVFKICDTDIGYFLIQLKRNSEGKFEMVKNNQIDHADQVVAEMTKEYGIKCVLTGKRKIFMLDDKRFIINLINERGNFLVISGENPTQDIVTTQLGITNPEYITVSFDNLPAVAPTKPTQPSPAPAQ